MSRTAIVTGASRGIGEAIARCFAEHGYQVALISRDHVEIGTKAEELNELGACAFGFQCDVSQPDEVINTFNRIANKCGSIDVLVNNAGINARKTLPKESLDDIWSQLCDDLAGFSREISVNCGGTYLCSYVAANYMRDQDEGTIINIASVKGKEPTSSPGYGASKAAVIKLTKDFAKSLAPNIRVNCIAPGFIATGMTLELPDAKKEHYMQQIPMQRFGDVDEIAQVALFLASSAASYITGATIDVNGGYLMD
jgi:3-oxoacyl-[acyl-carrier protein] reductase